MRSAVYGTAIRLGAVPASRYNRFNQQGFTEGDLFPTAPSRCVAVTALPGSGATRVSGRRAADETARRVSVALQPFLTLRSDEELTPWPR